MKNIIIGVAGPSGSGKTLFSELIINEFKNTEVLILRADMYYKDSSHLPYEKRLVQNYDHPDAVDNDLLVDHIKKLKDNQPIESPIYDFTIHVRKKETTTINPCPIIILEGILLFANDDILKELDIKIFVDTPLDICLSRKIYRDSIERGRNLESVIAQYTNFVRPMYFKFIEPSKKHADLIVPRGGKNKMAVQIIQTKIKTLINK
ncbi:MAG: uridine kinase [Candidatus Midichloriaceae bacterium]|jgi:uridine kinase